MDFAPTYLIERFFYRIVSFFRYWYVDGSRAIGNKFITTLESADRTFAVKITLRYLFEPLYKDYSAVGRIIGFIFRVARIIIGSILYILIAILFLLGYFLWLATPAILIWFICVGI